MEYDDIIVGGGSAGAVLAARLSQDASRRVLLLEAGPDYSTIESTPADLQNGWRMSLRTHDWGMSAEAVPGRPIPYPRARDRRLPRRQRHDCAARRARGLRRVGGAG